MSDQAMSTVDPPSVPDKGLGGKSAIVTGAAGGLGLAITRVFLLSKARVTLVDINSERLEAAKDSLVTQDGYSADDINTIVGDITSEDEVKRIVDEHVAKFGGLDVLINNAGIMDKFDAVDTCEVAMWSKVMAVNLTAPFMFSKYAVQKFLAKEKPSGVILNVGSTAGMAGFRAGCAYTASKHALVGLTKNTAAFYGKKGIRCNIIMPGGMQTNVGDAFADGGMNMEGYQTLLTTTGMEPPQSETQYMANLVQYLVSDAARVVNGAVISADQGWSAY